MEPRANLPPPGPAGLTGAPGVDLGQVLSQLAEGVAVVDPAGRIRYANPEARGILGGAGRLPSEWRGLLLAGERFEIPARYRHLTVVHLRYARWDLTQVDLVDPRTGAILCPVKPLDKSANANGQRRRLVPVGADSSPLPPSGIAPLLRQLLADYAATGLPPAYLPPPDKDPA